MASAPDVTEQDRARAQRWSLGWSTLSETGIAALASEFAAAREEAERRLAETQQTDARYIRFMNDRLQAAEARERALREALEKAVSILDGLDYRPDDEAANELAEIRAVLAPSGQEVCSETGPGHATVPHLHDPEYGIVDEGTAASLCELRAFQSGQGEPCPCGDSGRPGHPGGHCGQGEPCSCHSGSVCGDACAKGKHHDGCVGEPANATVKESLIVAEGENDHDPACICPDCETHPFGMCQVGG